MSSQDIELMQTDDSVAAPQYACIHLTATVNKTTSNNDYQVTEQMQWKY